MMQRATIRVLGLVQGVGYRRFAEKRARAIGLNGFVRNEDSGAVCVDVEGERVAIETYIEQLRTGPAFARVSDVNVQWLEYEGRYRVFEIMY